MALVACLSGWSSGLGAAAVTTLCLPFCVFFAGQYPFEDPAQPGNVLATLCNIACGKQQAGFPYPQQLLCMPQLHSHPASVGVQRSSPPHSPATTAAPDHLLLALVLPTQAATSPSRATCPPSARS